MNEGPFISACMIVKNEEACLIDCLESIRGVADEIVVVDTGSTDRTVEIARAYTDRIYYHPWQDDFAAHRNQSIGYAEGEWILVIDADERLLANRDDILKILRNPSLDAVGFRIVNRSSEGEIVFDSPRLFKNNIGCHYMGIIHEQLTGPRHIQLTDLEIHHTGYQGDAETTQKKFERNSALLQCRLREKPDDIFSHINLAVSFMTVHRYEEACSAAQHAVSFIESKDENDPLFRHAFIILLRLYLKEKRYDHAEEICLTSLRRYGPDPQVLAGLILVQIHRANWQAALDYGWTFLAVQSGKGDAVQLRLRNHLVAPFETWQVLLWIAQACVMTEELDKARRLFDRALDSAPAGSDLAIEIGAGLIRAGHRSLGLSYMTRPFAAQ